VAIASGLASLVVACSLVVSLDDLRSGNGDASLEAGNEGGLKDGGDASCSGFCACGPTHVLCHDFDGDGGLVGPFNANTVVGDASSSLDTTRFASSPRSATFKYVPSSTAYQSNTLTYTITSTASSMTAEAKIFMPAHPSAHGRETIDVGFPGGYEVDYVINDTHEDVIVGCYAPCQAQFDASASPYTSYTLNLVLPLNKWVDVKMAVTLTPDFAVTVTYDDSPAFTLPKGLYTSTAAQPTLYVGAVFTTGDAGPFEVGIDDITFDWTP